MVHDCKLRVDGITKFLDNTDFAFDHAFDEAETTEALYHYTAAPLVPFIFQVGSVPVPNPTHAAAACLLAYARTHTQQSRLRAL